jgi:hypothetical protein
MIGHKLSKGQKLQHKYAGTVVVIEDEDETFFMAHRVGNENESIRLHKAHVRQTHDSN